MQKEQQKAEEIAIPIDLQQWIKKEMAEYSENENHQISFYDGFEAHRKLTETKPSPVIEIGEEKGENSWDQTPKQAANYFVKYGPKVKLLTEARYQAFLAGVDWSRSLTNPPASHPAAALIDRFVEGYVCCIVGILRGHGIDTSTEEAFKNGVGSIEKAVKAGCPESDIEELKKYFK